MFLEWNPNKSATVVIAFLMKRYSLSFRAAIDRVKRLRPIVCPNLGFEIQLKQYEKECVRLGARSLSKRRALNSTLRGKSTTLEEGKDSLRK